jgi:tight adherence protein B
VNFLLELTGSTLFLTTLVTVFLCVSVLTYGLFIISQDYMTNYKKTFTESASSSMSDMFMFVDTNRLFYINISAIIILPFLTWVLLGDPVTTITIFILVAIMPTFLYRSMQRKRLRRFEEQLPDGLIMLSGSMRAGASLNIALESMVKEQPAPLSQEFELFMREQRIGVDFDVSLQNMEKRLPLQDFAMLAAALRINRDIGGNLAEIIETLAETLRRKHQMEGKIESLTAQGKLQGIVMTGLPVLLGVLLFFLEREAMEKLWTTTIGWIVLGVIIIMEAMGYLMIRKITSIDV